MGTKDADYLKNIKTLPDFKSHSNHIKILQKYVFPKMDNPKTKIHHAILCPADFFNKLGQYAHDTSVKEQDRIPIDNLANSIASIIINTPFLIKSKLGQEWLAQFDMMFIKPLQDAPSSKLSDYSKNLYQKQIVRIKGGVWCEDNKPCDRTLYTILHNPEQFFAKLEEYAQKTKGRIAPERRGDSTQKGIGVHAKDNIITALVALFIHNETFQRNHEDLFKKWKDLQEAQRKPLEQKYLSNAPTKRQADGLVELEDAISIRDTLEDGSYDRLLLTLYTDMPPVRSDFYNTPIYKKETEVDQYYKEKGNYILLTEAKGTFVMNRYKTAKKYGENRINLRPETMRQLRLSLEKTPRLYLFMTTPFLNSPNQPKPYVTDNYDEKSIQKGAGAFNKWANRRLKVVLKNKDVSLTTFRHVFLSQKELDLGNKTGLQRQEIANAMCHGVGQQEKYRWIQNKRNQIPDTEETSKNDDA